MHKATDADTTTARACVCVELAATAQLLYSVPVPYRAKDLLIGSGPVKAACKRMVRQRLKGTGVRWGESSAGAVCHLWVLFHSEKGQRDAYWASLAA